MSAIKESAGINLHRAAELVAYGDNQKKLAYNVGPHDRHESKIRVVFIQGAKEESFQN